MKFKCRKTGKIITVSKESGTKILNMKFYTGLKYLPEEKPKPKKSEQITEK